VTTPCSMGRAPLLEGFIVHLAMGNQMGKPAFQCSPLVLRTLHFVGAIFCCNTGHLAQLLAEYTSKVDYITVMICYTWLLFRSVIFISLLLLQFILRYSFLGRCIKHSITRCTLHAQLSFHPIDCFLAR
jgi:hypothetical protein